MQFKLLSASFSVAVGLVAPTHDLLATTDAILASHQHHQASEVVESKEFWKSDCFKSVPAYGLLQIQGSNPGAGMQPDEIAPYQTVLKDGFLRVACVKDAMYVHGDKFGNNKFDYKMGPITNSSIVHYTDFVPKEDRAAMTPSVCFEFCRGIPDMGFFGISNGRDCYCTSFYEAMASDSSNCDSVCEGEVSMMCGGKTKNSIFSMHMCDSTEEDLKKATQQAEAVESSMEKVCGGIKTVADSVEGAALDMQKVFGSIGDPSASNQMQVANEHAGEWLHKAEKCLDVAGSVTSLLKGSDSLKGKDMKDYKNVKAVEQQTANLEKASKEGADLFQKQVAEWKTAQPLKGSAVSQANQFLPAVLDQYYSLMYFVDKEFADDEKFPVTCDGDLLGEPALGLDAARCAAACDDQVGKCVGFAAYELHDGKEDVVLCFLFSKFTTAQYYTGCEGEEEENSEAPQKIAPQQKAGMFLQQKKNVHNRTAHKHKDAIASWITLHKNKVHSDITAQAKAECAKKRSSVSCQDARAKILPAGKSSDICYLEPGQMWTFDQLPDYYSCLNACCEDYNPANYMDGLTCKDLMGYYDKPCPEPLAASNPPPNTKIETICPQSCTVCTGPVEAATTVATTTAAATTTTTTTTTMAALTTHAPVVVIPKKLPSIQPNLQSEIRAMCRAKLSRFVGTSLKPDESGKDKFALKELTKADRCFD